MKKLVFIALALVVVLVNCKKESEVEYVLPKTYLPAYPGSHWDYSNGERSVVSNSYHAHNYDLNVNSTQKSETKLVPVIDGKYLYEYSIYQDFPNYPLKKLLDENVSEWVINKVNGAEIKRGVVSIKDSVIITLTIDNGYQDTMFRNVITVVEFIDSLSNKRWNKKEYYAEGVGLIKTEINDPFSPTDKSVVQKVLQRYHINK